MKLQCQSRCVLRHDIGKRHRGDGIGVGRVGGNVHQPLETRYIGEIDELATRREARQEIGKTPTIFGEHRALGGMAANELVRSIGEEALVNQPAHGRKCFAQRRGQRCENIVAVDPEPLFRRKAVSGEERTECIRIPCEDRVAECRLYLMQRKHQSPP